MMKRIIYALIIFFVQISTCVSQDFISDDNYDQYERVTNYKSRKDDYACLAINIYYEAGIEAVDAKLGVAHVTLNRVRSGLYPSSICSVVYQGCQFVWTCEGPKKPPYGEYWDESQRIAYCVLNGRCKNNVGDALHFHDNTVRIAYHNKNIIIMHKSKKMVFYKYRIQS